MKSKIPLTEQEQFKEIENTRAQIEELGGIKKCYFLTNIPYKAKVGPVISEGLFLPVNNPRIFDLRMSKLREYPDISPKFISKDKTAICVYISPNKGYNKDETLNEIRSIISKTKYAQKHIIGKTITEDKLQETLKIEAARLSILAVLLMLVVFFLFHPSFKSLLFFGWTVTLSISSFFLFLWLFEITLNSLNSTVPLLITVLSLSDAIHILNRAKQTQGDLNERSKSVFRKIGLPLALTSITTASGFAIFIFTGYHLIIEFALLAVTGIFLSYLIARYFTPHLLFLVDPHLDKGGNRMDKIILKINAFAQRRAGFIIITSILILFVGSFMATNKLQINHFIYGQLKKESEQGKSIAFYEKYFGGIRKISLFISAEKDLLNPESIQTLETIERYLLKVYGASSITSINTAIKRHNRFKHSGNPDYYRIPKNLKQRDLNKVRQLKSELGLGGSISEDGKSARIIASSEDQGSSITAIKNKKLIAFLEMNLPKGYTYYIGGPTTLQDKALTNITRYILYGILGAILLVALFLGLLFKSYYFGLVGVLANSLPLVGVLILYVLFQIDLNPMNVMLLSIVLGVAIDDTIYILSNVLVSQKEKPDKPISFHLNNSLITTGKPIITTSFLLIVGFLALSFSSFESNYQNGIFFMLAIAFALFSDLLLVPAILSSKYKSKVL